MILAVDLRYELPLSKYGGPCCFIFNQAGRIGAGILQASKVLAPDITVTTLSISLKFLTTACNETHPYYYSISTTKMVSLYAEKTV